MLTIDSNESFLPADRSCHVKKSIWNIDFIIAYVIL